MQNLHGAIDRRKSLDAIADEEIQPRVVPQPSLELVVPYLERKTNQATVVAEREVQPVGLDVQLDAVVVDVVAPVEVEEDEVGLEAEYAESQGLQLQARAEAGDAEVEHLDLPSGSALAVEPVLETGREGVLHGDLERLRERISEDGDPIGPGRLLQAPFAAPVAVGVDLDVLPPDGRAHPSALPRNVDRADLGIQLEEEFILEPGDSQQQLQPEEHEQE
jgi:hypothetical protein